MRSFQVISWLVALVFASAGQAHQQKESYTTILFNQRTGNLEVSHRFYLHDAEHAISKMTGKNADLTNSLEAKSDFANYIRNAFQLKNEKGVSILLAVVGHEVEGKYFWVYQETAIHENMNKLKVRMSALQEVWPSQINQVNVEKNGLTRGVRIDRNDDWKSLVMDN